MSRDHARNGHRGSEDGGSFQPTVDLRTARAVGVAAELGPSELRPPIEHAVRAAGDWWQSGLGLQLALSLPPGVFQDADPPLDKLVEQALDQTALPPAALQLGVPAEALGVDGEDVPASLDRLSELGVGIRIDRFGTARLSMRDLVRLPIQDLQIDPSLIRDFSHEEESTIVRSTVRLAHQLGMRVLASGVDGVDAWWRLRGIGVDKAQGSLISEPLSAREIPAWLVGWDKQARNLRSTRFASRRTEVAAAGA